MISRPIREARAGSSGCCAGDQSQIPDDSAGLTRPIHVQLPGIRVEEDDLGHVGPDIGNTRGIRGKVPSQQGMTHGVPGQHITAPPENDRWNITQRLQEFEQGRVCVFHRRPSLLPLPGQPGRIDQHRQVLPFNGTQPQRTGDGVQHLR